MRTPNAIFPKTRSGKPRLTATTTLTMADLKNGQPITLNRGEYHIDTSDELLMSVTGESVYTTIFCHQPANISYWSEIDNVRLVPTGEHAALRLDRGARAGFYKVTIASALPYPGHIAQTTWDYTGHQGIGIEVSAKTDGDNSWMPNFDYLTFMLLTVGVKASLPDKLGGKQPGTGQWQFRAPVFDSVRYPFQMQRCNEWLVLGGMAQLAERVIDIDGSANEFHHFHIERSVEHIVESAASIGNHFYTDALTERCTLGGEHRRWQRMWNRNISNLGESKKTKRDGTGKARRLTP